MAKTILGIDPGIADTGIGVISIDKGKMACLFYTSIKTSPRDLLPRRIKNLYIELNRIISKFKPDLIAIEQLYFCNNVKTALVVGQARGAAILCAELQNIPVIEFTPLQVKQAVSAYGKASKLQVQKMVKMILHLEELPKPDDAADALAVAISAANA